MELSKGFTLLELMVGVAILTIVTALAVPDFRGYIVNTKTRGTSRKVYSLIQSARILAAKEGQDVFVAFGDSSNSATASFSEIFVGFDQNNDGKLEKSSDDIRDRLTVKDPVKAVRIDAAKNQLRYNPRGFLSGAATSVKLKNDVTSRTYTISVSAVGGVNISSAG